MIVTITQLWIYPVKALGGARVERARVDDRGLEGDRRFMVVDADGRFLTQRRHPRMACVRARLDGPTLRLEHAGGALDVPREVEGPAREVRVWEDRVSAVDAGDEAAAWLSDAIGEHARLVRMPEATRRPADPRHARAGDLVAFADGFPFLLVSESSLEALAARLEAPIDVRRFRPNLVVGGAPAWSEDRWRELETGSLRLLVRKPCGRCRVVNVDPERGTAGTEPLATLATFRTEGHAVIFGQNLVHDGAGELSVGEPARVTAG